MENRSKKRKYIYTIFLKNQFCISSLNYVTVLLKSVHAVRQCLHKGPFSKTTSFSMENEYLLLFQISSLELISSKTGMALYCSNNCIIMRSNRYVAQRSREFAPIVKGDQPETIEDSQLALNNPGCVARAHPTAALSD